MMKMECMWGHDDCKYEDISCLSCLVKDRFYSPKNKPKRFITKNINKQDNRKGSKFEYKNHKNNENLVSSNMTINSGATAKEKGDEQIRGIINVMEELKTQMPDRARGNTVFTIKRKWLDKLHAEALKENMEFWYLKFCFNEEEAVYNGDQIYCITEENIIMSMIKTMIRDRKKAAECDATIDLYKKKYMELEAKNSALMAELEALKSSIDYASIKDKISKMF